MSSVKAGVDKGCPLFSFFFSRIVYLRYCSLNKNRYETEQDLFFFQTGVGTFFR